MSLVNEALKKARREAARQEAGKRKIPFPAFDSPPPPRRTRTVLLGAIVAIVLLLAALAFVLGPGFLDRQNRKPVAVTEATDRPAPEPAPETIAATEVAATEPATVPTAAPDSASQPIPEARVERETSQPPAPTTPSRETAEAENPRDRPSNPERPAAGRTDDVIATAADRRATVEPAEAEPATADESTGNGAAESHLRTVDIPSIGSVQLDGIAWSPERPFALLNGQIVGQGGSVQGARVAEIRPAEVVLEKDGRSYVLRLR